MPPVWISSVTITAMGISLPTCQRSRVLMSVPGISSSSLPCTASAFPEDALGVEDADQRLDDTGHRGPDGVELLGDVGGAGMRLLQHGADGGQLLLAVAGAGNRFFHRLDGGDQGAHHAQQDLGANRSEEHTSELQSQ